MQTLKLINKTKTQAFMHVAQKTRIHALHTLLTKLN